MMTRLVTTRTMVLVLTVGLLSIITTDAFHTTLGPFRSSSIISPRPSLTLLSTVASTQRDVASVGDEPMSFSSGGEEEIRTDAVVCGGGPAGLLTAIMLAQKFPERKVKVFDRLGAPPLPTDNAVWGDVAKFYLIGMYDTCGHAILMYTQMVLLLLLLLLLLSFQFIETHDCGMSFTFGLPSNTYTRVMFHSLHC